MSTTEALTQNDEFSNEHEEFAEQLEKLTSLNNWTKVLS
jgi:hypothetical protein